jgi:hypothetical protein
MLALLFAMAGTGYAAAVLPRDSVGTVQLRAGAVRSGDIAAGAVTSAKVRNGTLLAADFAARQLPSGAAGPAGPFPGTRPSGKTIRGVWAAQRCMRPRQRPASSTPSAAGR